MRAILQANSTLSEAQALAIAMTCRQLVAAGRIGSVLTNGSPQHPCEVLPIYIPGADAGQASEHKLASISAEGYIVGNWVNWRQAVPLSSIAYTAVNGEEQCLPGLAGLECDEYPYNASLEAGPRGVPSDSSTWVGFTLSLIPEYDNQLDGRRFQEFKVDRACGLTDATSSGTAIEGVPFLVIPMPVGVPTGHVCRQQP